MHFCSTNSFLFKKSNAALRLQIRFESDRLWQFFISKVQLKLFNAKRSFCASRHFILTQCHCQSTNQSMRTLSDWSLVDSHWSSAMRILFLADKKLNWTFGNQKKLKRSLQLSRIWRLKEIQNVPYKKSGFGDNVYFFGLWFQTNTQISKKSSSVCQINEFPPFSCQVWNSAVLWQSVINVGMTFFCFMSNQSIKRWFYF